MLRCRPNGRRRDSRISGRAIGESRNVERNKNAPLYCWRLDAEQDSAVTPKSARPRPKPRADHAIERQSAAVRRSIARYRRNARSDGSRLAPARLAAPTRTRSTRERSKRRWRSNRHRPREFAPEPAAMLGRMCCNAARLSRGANRPPYSDGRCSDARPSGGRRLDGRGRRRA